jgi:acyl-CoA synthetase (NDP forming)
LAVVADGGGTGVIAADVAAAAGLELPTLSDGLRRRLAAELPPTSVTTNPVDLAGAGEQDFGSYERVVGGILASGEVDAVLLTGYLGGYGLQSDTLAEPELGVAHALAGAAEHAGRPLVGQLMYWDAAPARALRAEGVPVYRDVEGAVGALARVTAVQSLALGVPEIGLAADRPAGDDGYLAARDLVESAGVPLAPARAARTADEAVGAAEALGYPVVLKALGLLHKSDAGGVVLGLADAGAVAAAVGGLQARLQPSGYAVEPLVDRAAGVELIVGCRRDPRFGPLLLVGLGGVHAEVLRDTAVALAPATAEQAEALLRSLRGASLLEGVRGRPAVDVRAAAEAAAALSRLAARRPEIAEIEVNPLLALPTGAIGLDARIVYDERRS